MAHTYTCTRTYTLCRDVTCCVVISVGQCGLGRLADWHGRLGGFFFSSSTPSSGRAGGRAGGGQAGTENEDENENENERELSALHA